MAREKGGCGDLEESACSRRREYGFSRKRSWTNKDWNKCSGERGEERGDLFQKKNAMIH